MSYIQIPALSRGFARISLFCRRLYPGMGPTVQMRSLQKVPVFISQYLQNVFVLSSRVMGP